MIENGIPKCPHCHRTQFDFEGLVQLRNADYGETVPMICEIEDCEEVFYVTKIATPSYISRLKKE